MTQHTPGPWEIERTAHRDLWITGPGGRIVGTVEGVSEEALANAVVMAAAPRMVAELRVVAEWSDLLKQCYPDMAGLVRAAVEARAILREIDEGGQA